MDGGPIVLMGIDAEDCSQGGCHGPISNYATVVSSILTIVSNRGEGILVFGGGKNRSDDVTRFWNAISLDTRQTVTYVNEVDIANKSFSGFSMLAITSSEASTPSGGLTQAENKLLANRQTDIVNFINNGGGLIGFSQTGLTNPYAYLATLGSFDVNINLNYDNITSTPAGESIGISDDDLDAAIWHDEYKNYPSFLSVLAINGITGNAAAIGGLSVVVPTGCPVANPKTCYQPVIELKIQLVSPALANSVITLASLEEHVVGDVCLEKVIVCGKLTKVIPIPKLKEMGIKARIRLLMHKQSKV